MADVDELQGTFARRPDTEAYGMGMHRKVTDAELARQASAPESCVTVPLPEVRKAVSAPTHKGEPLEASAESSNGITTFKHPAVSGRYQVQRSGGKHGSGKHGAAESFTVTHHSSRTFGNTPKITSLGEHPTRVAAHAAITEHMEKSLDGGSDGDVEFAGISVGSRSIEGPGLAATAVAKGLGSGGVKDYDFRQAFGGHTAHGNPRSLGSLDVAGHEVGNGLIGETSSGKGVYRDSRHSMQSSHWTPRDHAEAAGLHASEASRHSGFDSGSGYLAAHHERMATMHRAAASGSIVAKALALQAECAELVSKGLSFRQDGAGFGTTRKYRADALHGHYKIFSSHAYSNKMGHRLTYHPNGGGAEKVLGVHSSLGEAKAAAKTHSSGVG